MNKTQAQALWNRLRSGLLGVEQSLKEIVENRAWEPLGYASFSEAWKAELAGLKLAGAVQASAVLALYSSGATAEEVQEVVEGVGPKKAKAYQQAHAADFTPSQAYNHANAMERVKLEPGETYVKAHKRKPYERRNGILLDGFSDDQIQAWKKAASEKGVDFNDWCKLVFERAMKLETRGVK